MTGSCGERGRSGAWARSPAVGLAEQEARRAAVSRPLRRTWSRTCSGTQHESTSREDPLGGRSARLRSRTGRGAKGLCVLTDVHPTGKWPKRHEAAGAMTCFLTDEGLVTFLFRHSLSWGVHVSGLQSGGTSFCGDPRDGCGWSVLEIQPGLGSFRVCFSGTTGQWLGASYRGFQMCAVNLCLTWG